MIVVLQTAEMPGLYSPGEYDVAGFAVGSVKQDRLIDGKQIQEGDVLIALPSSGLHSNGYSLVRKVVEASTSIDTGNEILLQSNLVHAEPCCCSALTVHMLVPKRLSCPCYIGCCAGLWANCIPAYGQMTDLHLLTNSINDTWAFQPMR